MTTEVQPINIKTLAVVGLGLIGASLALALKKAGIVDHLLGVDSAEKVCHQALQRSVVDGVVTLEQAAAQADILILCVPVAKTEQVLRDCLPHLRPQTIVSDTGSTKENVVMAAKAVLGERVVQFIPAHPIAGREQNGLDAALADLFQGKKVMLCPLQENRQEDVHLVHAIWSSVGSQCYALSALQHDAIFAANSHLPHLLAYALVAQISNAEDAQIKLDFAGSGFRDFTRIAGSSAEIWRDICLGNRTALLEELSTYQTILAQLKNMIEQNQDETLHRFFQRASATRLAWQKKNEVGQA